MGWLAFRNLVLLILSLSKDEIGAMARLSTASFPRKRESRAKNTAD